MPANIFISYSHKDENWKELVVKFLRALGNENLLVWDDRQIPTGSVWLQEIKDAILRADIAVLLISVDFLTSRFIMETEIPELLNRRQEEGLRIIPFIIRSCPWRQVDWLSQIQALPKDGRPLIQSGSESAIEAELTVLAEEVWRLLVKADQAEPSEQIKLEKKTKKDTVSSSPDQSREMGDEENYLYQANRFGMGYRMFTVKCEIEDDGSAKVIRTVDLEAFSLIKEIDTTINIPEKDPDGRYRDIQLGKIKSSDNRQLTLSLVYPKPGMISGKINIQPALQKGERLKYQVYDYYLPKELFAIDLTPEEYENRENPNDYFGWHITRPTRKLIFQIQFPFGNRPNQFWSEVHYAASSALPQNEVQLGEQRRLVQPVVYDEVDQDLIRLDVDYPLSELIYILYWKPVLKSKESNGLQVPV